MNEKFILDACCGARMFWFNKQHPNTIYIDKRKEEKGFIWNRDKREINPDIIMDFKKMDFKDKSFKLIIWDPPHIIHKNGNSIMTRNYGHFTHNNWKNELSQGFKEIWRVLDDYGILIFKFNNVSIPFKEVLSLFPITPLIGQKSSHRKKSITKWFCFMKIP